MAKRNRQKTLSVDLETFSAVDLSKAGVYRYAEDPSFEILLFGYAFDADPVRVVDLASGETIPEEIRAALQDPEITKTAWNANFERVCLWQYLRFPQPPEAWDDTMIRAAELGLPKSLADAGRVLGLEEDKQKMKEGKTLIQFFSKPCRPSKANGMRDRNRPEDDPEKWATYKDYNARDVETEREIRKHLERFAIHEDEQTLWCIDQEINDRGVMFDRRFVENACRLDERIRMQLKEEARRVSGLDNPNSVIQIKKWIQERTGVKVDSLDRRQMAGVLDQIGDDETVVRFLEIRGALSKTSTAKYSRMLGCVNRDDRVRGLSQFYGASRTGRWCLAGDHEVLTPDGWTRLDDLAGTMKEILCWNAKTEVLSFQKAKGVQFDYKGEMYCYEQQRVSQIATPDHRMPVLGKDGTWTEKTVGEIGEHQTKIAFTGRRLQQPRAHASVELRILIMTQADGHYTSDGALRFHFSKERKKERCEKLLHDCDIPHTYNDNADGTATITIKPAYLPIWLRTFKSKTFGFWLLDEPAEVLFDELVFWDGYAASKNSMQYTTTNRQNADVVQACALCAGYSATLLEKKRSQDGWSTAYYVNIWRNPGQGTGIRKNQISKVAHDGPVYCAETPTGFFAVRRNGKVWITGNSGRNVQLQNLKRNSMPDADLDAARRLVRAGDFATLGLFYDETETLSELIRTSFVPAPGCKFVVSDFSAIEARVLAWLAGEKWRMDVFNGDGKIYEASAEKMFHLPPGSVKKGDPMRQKGKIAELALGYGGSVGAMKAMGALEMGLQENELKPIVDSWRAANRRITALWWDIDKMARAVIKRRTRQRMNNIAMRMDGPLLRILLPSGREISYLSPKINADDAITYEGQIQAGGWGTIETYGPKLVENIIQAISRDCLAESMRRLHEARIPVVFHVHDEVICEVPEAFTIPSGSAAGVAEIMSRPIDWAPGLLMKADAYECEYYRKD
ncbi:MAG: hypothetical protein IKF75_01810 [Lachnospiraceae bacterium]|nr:hypothetical protein [Lachnospiraceae bacterium]